jgi:hypothetical protein
MPHTDLYSGHQLSVCSQQPAGNPPCKFRTQTLVPARRFLPRAESLPAVFSTPVPTGQLNEHGNSPLQLASCTLRRSSKGGSSAAGLSTNLASSILKAV